MDEINVNDIPDAVLLKYCIRDYKREKQLREQYEVDLVSLKRSLNVMTDMCEMVIQPTTKMISEWADKKIAVYKSSNVSLNKAMAELKAENANLASINRELMKRIELLEKMIN